MFGTELDTAYFDNTVIQNNNNDIIQLKNTNVQKQEHALDQTTKPITYDPKDALINPVFQQNEQKILELQKELEQQKHLNSEQKREYEPLVDRYLSKKKDVFKLINISLTVLLGISTHYVISDLIKNYLLNNDFTSNKENLIKVAYPVFVFLLLWSFKVFNK